MAEFTQDGKNLEILFEGDLVPQDALLLTSVAGQEALCRPYSYRVEMLGPDVDYMPDPKQMVGLRAAIGVRLHKDDNFFFRDGLVRNFQVGGLRGQRGRHLRVFRAEIVPPLTKLQYAESFRIFQDQTVVDILKAVLAEYEIAEVEWKLSAADYPPLEYCVQAGESDLAFFSRLIEENGLFYYWRPNDKWGGLWRASTMVVGDKAEHFEKLDPFTLTAGVDGESGQIHSWEHVFELRSTSYLLGDFSFATPDNPPQVQKKRRWPMPQADLGLQRTVFPQRAQTTKELDTLADVLMTAEDGRLHATTGAGEVVAMAPGYRFENTNSGVGGAVNELFLLTSLQFTAVEQSYDQATLTDVLAGLLKGLWSSADDKLIDLGPLEKAKDNIAGILGKKTGDLLLSIGSSLLKGGPTGLVGWLLTPFFKPLVDWFKDQGKEHSKFANTFIAAPGKMMFRPPRITPKPRFHGPHTALVVGPKGIVAEGGADVFTDQFGRVKVWFPWDGDEGAHKPHTAWIRVAEGWAGGKWGTQFAPRVGNEVVVQFLDGDPDRPIITGRLYNPKSPQPFDANGQPPAQLPPGPMQPASAQVQTSQRRSGIKTASTPRPKDGPSRFHLLRFDDNWEKEQLLIRSQGRTDVTSFADYHETVHGNRHLKVGGVDPDTGKGGGSLFIGTGGEYDLCVHEARYESVEGVCQVSVKGDVTFDFQANLTAIMGDSAKFNAKEVVIEASQKITLKVGGSFVVVDPAGVYIKGAMVQINSGGSPGSTSSADVTDAICPSPGDPGDPQNWLQLHPPQQGGGGRRHHTAVAHHGLSVTRNPNGSLAVAPGITVVGTPEYQDAVVEDLARMNDTPTGHQVIDNIGGSGRTVTIADRPAGTSVTDTGTVPANMTDAQNGTGTDSTVHYNPGDFPAPGTTTQAPSDVALYHEMTHADHAANGTIDMTPRTDGYDNNEEFNTIQDENTYRDQRGPWPGQPADYHRHDHSFAGV